jgi:hypothetical protein
MTAFRWILVVVIAVLAAAIGLQQALREPDPPAPAQPAEVAALPLKLPSAPQTRAPEAGSAPRAEAPALPTTKPPHIGSEGYGPHIELARAGDSASQAWEAVGWLRSCATNEVRRGGLEQFRNQGIATDFMTHRMQELDEEARLCQTVTAQHRAMLPELASRAMRAGVPEAASAYAGAVFPGDLTPEQRREVADAMRRDALTGNAASLLGAIVSNEAWGLTDTERLGFMYAYGETGELLGHKATISALIERGSIKFKAPPTQEQLAAAKVAGQQIIDRLARP